MKQLTAQQARLPTPFSLNFGGNSFRAGMERVPIQSLGKFRFIRNVKNRSNRYLAFVIGC